MPAKKGSFKMERGKQMIDTCQPLRHTGIVGIFRFESEPKETSRCCRNESSLTSAQAEVCRNLPEIYISVGDQPQANIVVHESRLRRAKDGPDKVVVEIRSPDGELRLFQRKEPVMVPWSLLKHRKR